MPQEASASAILAAMTSKLDSTTLIRRASSSGPMLQRPECRRSWTARSPKLSKTEPSASQGPQSLRVTAST